MMAESDMSLATNPFPDILNSFDDLEGMLFGSHNDGLAATQSIDSVSAESIHGITETFC